ncbi:MAG: formate/nitrite transporter family protein [Roseburia sp.]|nr:formate/nitrite transporter family protein [Roseburia sp.]
MNSSKDIAEGYKTVAQNKTSTVWYKLLILGALAGAFIAFGGALSTFAATYASSDAATLVKGAVFPVGLILIVICGAELFTGDCLLIAPLINKDVKLLPTLKTLGLAYIGNFIGAVLIAVLVVYSHSMSESVAEACVAVARNKSAMNFGYAMLRGILCNMLVCLAVWGAMASKSAGGKILVVYLPVFAFVVCGFEHSVANMYYQISGLIASAEYGIAAGGLNFGNSLLYCLLPSTLGNIIGGALIAVAYYAVYFRRKEPKNPDIAPNT